MFFKKVLGYIYFKLWSFGLWTPRDRQVLITEIFPFISKNYSKVLFVGVQKYTKAYEKYFFSNQADSLDPDPFQKSWGFKKHFISSIQNFEHPQALTYDAVIMNGVIGYGLNDFFECEQAIKNIHEILSERGLLVVGINPEKNKKSFIELSHNLQIFFQKSTGIRHAHHVIIKNEFFSDQEHHYFFYSKKLIEKE